MPSPGLLFGPRAPRPDMIARRRCPHDWLLHESRYWPIEPIDGILMYSAYYRQTSFTRSSLPRFGYYQHDESWTLIGLTRYEEEIYFQAALVSGPRAAHLDWCSPAEQHLPTLLDEVDAACQITRGRTPSYHQHIRAIVDDLRRIGSGHTPELLDCQTGRRYPPVWWLQQREAWPPAAGSVPQSCWNASCFRSSS